MNRSACVVVFTGRFQTKKNIESATTLLFGYNYSLCVCSLLRLKKNMLGSESFQINILCANKKLIEFQTIQLEFAARSHSHTDFSIYFKQFTVKAIKLSMSKTNCKLKTNASRNSHN